MKYILIIINLLMQIVRNQIEIQRDIKTCLLCLDMISEDKYTQLVTNFDERNDDFINKINDELKNKKEPELLKKWEMSKTK